MACVGFLQCTLKVLNFLLSVVGAGIILYSLWALNQWHIHVPHQGDAPLPTFGPSALAVPGFSSEMPLGMELPFVEGVVEQALPEEGVDGLPLTDSKQEDVWLSKRPLFVMASGSKLTYSLFPKNLPAPWFIYLFLGVGTLTCLITITGHIAAEITSACCLSCYTFCLGVMLILQAAAAAAIFFDENWYKDIPDDPTGELDKIRNFVDDNFDMCKWTALAVVVIEVLGLLLAMILRSVSGAARRTYDSDDDFLAPRSGARQPLLARQATQANGAPAAPADGRRTDAWSTRMREKYGFDTTAFTYNPSESRRVPQQAAPATEEKKGWCTIL